MLYKLWIDNSLNKRIADVLYVYLSETKEVLGMVSAKCNDDIVSIGLIAILDEARGQGIGSKLISAIENYAISIGCSKLYVTTQGDNKIACSFYESCGFLIRQEQFVYHIHTK